MVAPPMHGSKLDKIIAELFFIEISCFLFLLNNFSQIFDLADQLGRLSSCGSSSSGHHTCNSIGCTKVWLCWMMVSLKSFLLNIQRPFLKNAIPIIHICAIPGIYQTTFFSTAGSSLRQYTGLENKQNFQYSPLDQIIVTSSHQT